MSRQAPSAPHHTHFSTHTRTVNPPVLSDTCRPPGQGRAAHAATSAPPCMPGGQSQYLCACVCAKLRFARTEHVRGRGSLPPVQWQVHYHSDACPLRKDDRARGKCAVEGCVALQSCSASHLQEGGRLQGSPALSADRRQLIARGQRQPRAAGRTQPGDGGASLGDIRCRLAADLVRPHPRGFLL